MNGFGHLQVARSPNLREPLDLLLAACTALLLAACSGAGPTAAGDPPGKVQGLERVSRTATSITVSWTALARGEGVTGYELRWRVEGGTWTVHEVGSGATSYPIVNLAEDTAYEIRVRAVSGTVRGAWSDSLKEMTSVAGAIRGPANLTAGTITPDSAEVSWSPPATGAITRYQVQWRVASERDWSNADSAETAGGTTRYTLQGLAPGTTYLVRVRALTAQDEGDWSQPLTVTTHGGGTGGGTGGDTGGSTGGDSEEGTDEGMEESTEESTDTVIPAPGTVLAAAIDVSSIAVTWTLVTDPEGVTITGYEVDWEPGEVYTARAMASSYTITGLNPGTTYGVRVRAVAESTNGAWGSAGQVTTRFTPFVLVRMDSYNMTVTVPFTDGVARLLVRAIPVTSTAINVSINVSAPDFVPSSEKGDITFSVPANSVGRVLQIYWDGTAAPPSSDGTITATVKTGDGYGVGRGASASVTVEHDK